jgi:hypothetical protein
MPRSFGSVKAVVLSTTAGLIIGPSDKRVTLLFTPARGKRYTVSTDAAVTLDAGLTLFTEAGPLEITLDRHGDAVQKAWYGVAEAKLTIGLLETVIE